MFLHHRDQHIPRQGEGFIAESAHDGGWHLDKVCYFVEQAFFHDGFTANETSGFIHLLHNGCFAFLFI